MENNCAHLNIKYEISITTGDYELDITVLCKDCKKYIERVRANQTSENQAKSLYKAIKEDQGLAHDFKFKK